MSRLGVLLLSSVLILPGCNRWTAPTLTPEQREYFDSLYRQSWRYHETLVEKLTGFPYDSSARQPATSLANVGFYLAAVAVAYQTGLLPKDKALERTERVLAAIQKMEKWRGIPRSWFLVRSLKPTFGDEFSYGHHLSVLVGGLIVSKNTFPELAAGIARLLMEMDFKYFYDGQTGWLKGGYNIKTQNFAIYQPWGHWYYKHLASDTRLLSFYLIARGAAPASHWTSLLRPLQKKEWESFFVSGLEESGLGAQYLAGIFLDERWTEMGWSQRNYARFQMKYARKIRAPVWGWSSCQAPNGRYLAGGELKDEIVAPHASVLASIYFPKEAYENLRRLEVLGGRLKGEFGFRDSLNWKTKAVAQGSLTSSQGMTFLSLANLLHDGIVWKTFQSDPVARKALGVLKPYPLPAIPRKS